uniref:Peptidase S74 domain-containing protein n=1 Tax=viral metagenome TaxID=1070528 RepID=A0A6C0L7X3_9ZZZZ
MDDFIVQDTEPIVKVDSLGIGLNTIQDIQRLSLNDNEYLVVGDGMGTANNNSNQMDTKWNMYVNHDGVAINTSRYITSNYRQPNTSLYINRNIQCEGTINAHSIQFSNISISGEIGSNALIDLIKSVNILSQSQPFKTGVVTYFNNLYDTKYPVNNIYTPNYLTLGGLVDTNYNQHPLNINSTPNNDFNNIHIALRNDTYNTSTEELSKLSIGIIGGSNISPAVISTTKGMPLEFHVNKSAVEINSLYNREAVPTYLNDSDYAAMTIDNNGNVCIGKNKAVNLTYYKNILTDGISSRVPFTKQMKFDVKGASKFDDIIIFDNFANSYKHMDDVYIRADGVGSIRPSQITAGTFTGLSYSFNIVEIKENLISKNINVSYSLSSEIVNANKLVVADSATFRGTTSFENTTALSMNRLEIVNDLVIGGIRVNPINISDETLGYTTITSNTDNGVNKYFFTYVHSNIANLDANRNISFPNKLSVGPETSDGFTGVVNIFKSRSSNNNFEVILQDKVNANKYIANVGHLSYLDFYDNSLLINTNPVEGKKHNIYFYPSFDISSLENNVFRPNLINSPPMLAITNTGLSINTKLPHEGIHLDINGQIAATDYNIYKDDVLTKMSGFVYNGYRNYFNIYNEETYKYCINYDNISSYSTKMRGFNVKYGINSDEYYQNDKLIETLQVTNNPDSFYTNKKISLGWSGEDVHLPLQIRNTNIEDYNHSIIRIFRGVRGGGLHNNADFSGIDICEYDRDLRDDRDLEKWFIYKNHKYNDIDSRDVARIGPLQIGYTDKTIEPTSFGMSMYYNTLNSNYHVDFNNPTVNYDFIKAENNVAVSIYGDLDVHGNINIIDNSSNNFNFRLKKLEGQTDLSKYIDVVSVSNIIYKNVVDYEDIEHSGKNIVFKPVKSIVVDSIINTDIPFVIKQNNDRLSVAKFITYTSNLLTNNAVNDANNAINHDHDYSALELGIYKYNDFDVNYDKDRNNIKNMIQILVSNNNDILTDNTNLTFSYYKNDNNNDFYHSFVEFNNSFSKTYMHLGQGTSGYNSNISLHIDDDNIYGLQLTNTYNPVKINMANIAGDRNKYATISSGSTANNFRFTIDAAVVPANTEPSAKDLLNILTIDPYTTGINLRDGVRYGFNETTPLQTMSINSEYDEQTMLINARYTKDYIYSKVSVNSCNIVLTKQTNANYWDNSTKIYDTTYNNSISSTYVPTYDIFGSNIANNNTVVYKTLNDIKKITYLSIHSNIDLTYKFNETNANIINSNYKATDTIINSTPAYRIDFNKENLLENDRVLFSITPLLSDTSNEIMSLDEMRLVNNQTSNVFDITLNNNIISRNYKFSCIFNNIYNIPSYLSDITTSNTYFTSNYAMIVDTNRGITSNIISLNNEIFSYLPKVNSTTKNISKVFINKNLIKLGDINSLSNVYINSTTSNIVCYNFTSGTDLTYAYKGKFAIHRKNTFSINSSNIIPNTLSNSNYIIRYNSNITYADYNTGYNNISNILNISTSNEIIDGMYNTELIYVSSNIQIKDEFSIYGVGLSNSIIVEEYYRRYVKNSNLNIQLTNFNRTNLKPHIIFANSVKEDYSDRNSLINEIYSYDGNLKFNYRDNQFEHPQLLIDKYGNIQYYGDVRTSNDLYISGNIFNVSGINVIEDLDRKILSLETNNCNLLLDSVATLNATINTKEASMSNYVLSTNNKLINKADLNDFNMSNYVFSTSNILVAKADLNNFNMSNYVFSTSNILVAKADLNDFNMSNYVFSTSNILVAKADLNDLNMSNFILSIDNKLINKANTNDNNMISYVLFTSNILAAKADLNNTNMSNYVLSTSNIISRRITNLTTDMINENLNGSKKFIINNRYNNNLELNGTLTVTSNLIVLGASTTLETEVYTTERLEITNANNTSRALVIKQNDIINDIIRASNRDSNVFTLGNNGDVRITGNYIRNNRDVLLDTSNYVLETSNVIARRIDSNVATLNNTIRVNDVFNSNYVLSSSNNLAFSINSIKSAWVITSSNVFSLTNVSIGTTSNIDTLTVDGAIICSKGITTSFSDNRLKDYTSNIENPIALINRLNGFHFVPNDLAMNYGFTKTPDVGLSAQEVQSILPEIVRLAPFDMTRDNYNNIVSKSGDNFLTICYEKMAPLFVESIKALKKELDELKLEVAELRKGCKCK